MKEKQITLANPNKAEQARATVIERMARDLVRQDKGDVNDKDLIAEARLRIGAIPEADVIAEYKRLGGLIRGDQSTVLPRLVDVQIVEAKQKAKRTRKAKEGVIVKDLLKKQK